MSPFWHSDNYLSTISYKEKNGCARYLSSRKSRPTTSPPPNTVAGCLLFFQPTYTTRLQQWTQRDVCSSEPGQGGPGWLRESCPPDVSADASLSCLRHDLARTVNENSWAANSDSAGWDCHTGLKRCPPEYLTYILLHNLQIYLIR